MKSKRETLNRKRYKTMQKSNSKDDCVSFLTQPNKSVKQNESKYTLKTLLIKNLKTNGEMYPLNRNITIQCLDTIHNCQSYHHSMTPKSKISNRHNQSVKIDNQLKKRMQKPFEYSFKKYLILQLSK